MSTKRTIAIPTKGVVLLQQRNGTVLRLASHLLETYAGTSPLGFSYGGKVHASRQVKRFRTWVELCVPVNHAERVYDVGNWGHHSRFVTDREVTCKKCLQILQTATILPCTPSNTRASLYLDEREAHDEATCTECQALLHKYDH